MHPMGTLGEWLSKLGKPKDQTEAMRERADEHPTDARLQQDLAHLLKAKGDVVGAREYALRAARAHQQAGFAQKALAVLKGASGWGPPSTELLGELVTLHIDLKHKEDARGTLIELRKLHVSLGNKSELSDIDKKLTELGPGR